MANRKKLRRKFFNGELKLADMTEDEAKYMNKYIAKLQRDTQTGKDNVIKTYKEVACQKMPGKKVLVPLDANVIKGEDGLLYTEDKLIVSQSWKDMEADRKEKARVLAKKEKEQAVTELKPTKLGEE